MNFKKVFNTNFNKPIGRPVGKPIGKPSKGFAHKLFFSFVTFVYRIRKSLNLMTSLERKLAIFFGLLFFVLLGIKINAVYRSNTKLVPQYGGEYKEIVVGELKFMNPIVASSDVDKSISKLIFSGLIKVEPDGNVSPDLAESWSVSPDNLSYTFKLRENVLFHDGQVLTSSDISNTIELIKNPDLKSPLLERWKDVVVSTPDERTITFTLPKVYGPFLQSCDFGVLPGYLSFDQSSTDFVGTGPFKYTKMEQSVGAIGSRITQVYLEGNKDFYFDPPYIKKLSFLFYSDKSEALKAYKEKKANAISGLKFVESSEVNSGLKDLSFTTGKTMALIVNLRNEKFKDKNSRDLIMKGQRVETQQNVSLVALDSELHRTKAEEVVSEFENNNINLTTKYLSPVEMQNALDKKDYELILYGFDFSYDRDPYAFWHSSQVVKNNFSGLSDKEMDIKIEDARMLPNAEERNKKYDSILQSISEQSIAKFYDPIDYHFGVSQKIKGVNIVPIHNVTFKYAGIEKWYIKERRVKK